MNDFAKGMNSIGQLFPSPIPYEQYPPSESAWQGVANSFKQAGDSIQTALNEFADAQRENIQKT